MATDLCEGALQLNFAKKPLKMNKVLTLVKVSELILKLSNFKDRFPVLCTYFSQK